MQQETDKSIPVFVADQKFNSQVANFVKLERPKV